ncbi:TspO/MBR related protein [Rhodobacter aestuarii]|uniref:TspO and MBR related proteins n=1 Tax=Rhodobacter aestuarii TaxID=453582 RepID=A0A1N7MK56_9RHOB|nr:TspO/MBR family protein [Rhodobacter aestuarii]PTV96700.1 TspO/MBR related protein [Rhodobacter aestuarii]SIS86526.1 TspO and MBR related proteins [Rhodobacter aestuarii]
MNLLFFFIFLASCLTAGMTGAVFKPGNWYDSLNKPEWTPPNWVFPTAWTTLYILMSISAALVAAKAGENPDVGLALAVWGLQIGFNTLWTPIFFGLHRLAAGMVVLVGLWLSVFAMTVLFWQIDWVAGVLLLPYVAWTTIAGALNWSVWRRNPHEPVVQLD